MFAELCERVMDASLESDFDLSRRFVPVEGKGRRYWYFDRIVDGANRRAYVGPAADEEITRRVEDFRNLKNDRQARRKLVPTLVREAEFPRPESMTGDIVAAVAKAGLFKLRGMLVGTVAFQCLSGVLGVRLPSAAMQTADANFAQFHSISAAVGDSLPPMLNFLHEVDPSFHDVPRIAGGRASTQFASATGYKVEFLLPNYGKDEYGDTPAHMPAIGRAAAQPLRYLDFLIHEPVRSVLLHKSGIPVTVPMTAKGFTAELETSLRSIHAPKAAKLDAGAAISRASISSSPSSSVRSRTSRWSDRMYEIPLSRASRHARPRSQASVHAMARSLWRRTVPSADARASAR